MDISAFFDTLRSCTLLRPSTRLVTAIALLLGLAVLAASVTPPAIARAPGNDKFGHAAKIGSLPYHHEQSTRRAKTQDSDPPASCARIDQTVWFTLKRGSETTMKADTLGSDFDTVLVAYEQTGSGTGGLVEVACNDDIAADNNRSEITFTAKADTTYYLMAGTCCGTQDGHLKLNVVKE